MSNTFNYKKWVETHPNICKLCRKQSVEGTGFKVCEKCRGKVKAYRKATQYKIDKEYCDFNCLECKRDDCTNIHTSITQKEHDLLKRWIPEPGRILTIDDVIGKRNG